MYASISWQVAPEPSRAEALDAAVHSLLAGRPHTHLLERTVVCDLTDTQDYITLAGSLRALADQHANELFFVCFAHARNSPMR